MAHTYLQQFPPSEQTAFLPGPAGQLETILQPVQGAKGTAVICHPHPLKEGTMHNKVVTTLARAYKECGLNTIRFNYRGVGHSDGHYGDMLGEQEDLKAIIAWLKQVLPDTVLYLAGFSFGAWISASVAQNQNVQHLVNVAPAVNHADFYSLKPVTFPWIVIQGEADEVVPADEVFAWAQQMESGPKVVVFPEAGHFFHGKLVELRETLKAELQG